MENRVTFRSCGLGAAHNMLQAPICECGCGEYMDIILEDRQDLGGFIHCMLEEFDCGRCAIFALERDGTVTFGTKFDDDIKVYSTSKAWNVEKQCEFIRAMQEDVRFHCYGLMQQADADSYRIVME